MLVVYATNMLLCNFLKYLLNNYDSNIPAAYYLLKRILHLFNKYSVTLCAGLLR